MLIKNARTPQPLTQEAFAPFGDVIEVSDTKYHSTGNDGTAKIYHDLAAVELNADDGRTIIDIFRCDPLPLPIDIKMMERHRISSQAFIPLGINPYLVVVAPKGKFVASRLQVFLAQSHQGVNYHPGTWHHFCLALNRTSDFLVLDRLAEREHDDDITLSAEDQITVSVDAAVKINQE